MVLKNTSEAIRREKLGGCGIGAGNTFPVAIPDENGAFIMSTRLELDPGASVGYHKHAGTEEVYFIMAGKGLYTEEGEECPALPWCGNYKERSLKKKRGRGFSKR